MEASGMLAVAHRQQLKEGRHEAFFRGLEATQDLALTLLDTEGDLISMAGFWLQRLRWVGDELGSDERQTPWTRQDAMSLIQVTERTLASLKPDVRPLRYAFWEVLERGLEDAAGDESEGTKGESILTSEFAGREISIIQEVERVLLLPLDQAVSEAQSIRDLHDEDVLEYWYWTSVVGYLGALISARCEVETLRLALEVSLTGEPAAATSTRRHGIRAEVVGDFVEANEYGVSEHDEWVVRVPLVMDDR